MSLLEQHFDVAFAAPNGIKKLRDLILTLAMQGKLVPQDPQDEPASELLRSIDLEKQGLVKEGKIKQPKSLSDINLDELLYDLPKAWEWVRLGEIIVFTNGFAFKSNLFQRNGIGIIKIGDISNGIVNKNRMDFIDKKYLKEVDQKFQVNLNDLLIAMSGATTGKLGFNTIEEVFLMNQRVGKIEPIIVDKVYLYNFLSTQIQKNLSISSGSAIPNLSTEQINQTLIPLPPLAEQHRIVAKIDQLMARCDELEKLRLDRSQRLLTVHTAALDRLLTARDSSEFSTAWSFITQHFGELYAIKENVVELRKTILQLAVMGKLVRQDPNDEPSSVLVTRIKAERSLSKEKVKKDSTSQPSDLSANMPFQIPSSWTWQRVTDLYEVAGGIQKTPQRNPVSNFFPYLRVANVQRGRLDLNQIEYFELFDGELEKRNLQSGDLLVVEGNGSDKEIGRCAIWNGEIENCVHQNHIIRVRPIGHNGQLFTLTFLNSPCGMAEMKSLAITTSGLYSLSVGKIREILIPFPPLAEQGRIVEKIDRLMGMCDRLEESIESGKGKQTALLNALMSQV